MPKIRNAWHFPYHITNGDKAEPSISYHTSTFRLRAKKKIFMFLKQQNTGRHGCKQTIWIDGDEIGSTQITHGQSTPSVLSTRLKKGEHRILIRNEYQHGWDLTFHIGDISGLPLEDVEIPPSRPYK
ncbi:MAG: hypothetical protein HRU15_12120 [Planctomycetes bacterium]|nr:hypothetical protein [Planctomycetota bacterium]